MAEITEQKITETLVDLAHRVIEELTILSEETKQECPLVEDITIHLYFGYLFDYIGLKKGPKSIQAEAERLMLQAQAMIKEALTKV